MSEQTLSEEAPIFKAVNGVVLWRGTYLPEDNARVLMDLLAGERDDANDWFAGEAAALHRQLSEAVEEAYGVEQ